MRQHDARQRREKVSAGNHGGWYKEGARWGHGGDHQELGSQTLRKVREKPKDLTAAGDTPDLVRDCNEVALPTGEVPVE